MKTSALTAGALVVLSAGTALAVTTGQKKRPTEGEAYLRIYYNGPGSNPAWTTDKSQATVHTGRGFPLSDPPASMVTGNNLKKEDFNWVSPVNCGPNDPTDPSAWTTPETFGGLEGGNDPEGSGYVKYKQQMYTVDVTVWQ